MKRHLWRIVAILVLAVVGVGQADLIGDWTFDAATVCPSEDVSTTEADAYEDGISYVYDLEQIVAEFDGSSAIYTFEGTPQPCALSTAFTFGVRIKPDLSGTWGIRTRKRVFCRRLQNTWNFFADIAGDGSGNPRFRFVLHGDNGALHHANSRILTPEDGWMDIVVTWRAANPREPAVVYVNGDSTGWFYDSLPTFDAMDDRDARLLFGACHETFGPMRYFKGRIAKAKLWDEVIDVGDVFN